MRSHNMQRFHFLDAMRSILMMLGVVLHTAVVYSTNSWLQPDEGSVFYNHLVHVIHLFRMPAFFIISGFFCHLMLSRVSSSVFIKQKASRILLPLIITAITLNTLQNIILNDYRTIEVEIFSLEYWLEGNWVSHLWFLIALVYFLLLSTVVKILFPKVSDRLLTFSSQCLLSSKHFTIILLPLISLALIKVSHIFSLHIMNLEFDWQISESIKYSIYFYFGILTARHPKLLSNFTHISFPTLGISCFVIGMLVSLNPLGVITENQWLARIQLVVDSFSTWLLCYLCFILFHQLTNSPSKLFQYLSDASYTIYLFHHVLVIAFSILVIPLAIPIFIKFILVIIMTFASTIIIHNRLICKLPFMSILFNGKVQKR